MSIIQTYLKAKHWHLFILFLLPIVLFYVAFYSFFFQEIETLQKLENSTNINDEEMLLHVINLFSSFKYFFLIIIVSTLIVSFWNWSITIGLQNKIPDNLKINLTRFNIFFFIPLIYMSIICFLLMNLIDKLPEYITILESEINNEEFLQDKIFGILKYLPFVFIFHFLSIFSFFHTIFFTAKTIKLAELKRKLKSDEFIGDFFLLWFSFIGVWFIQPKINKLQEENNNKEELQIE